MRIFIVAAVVFVAAFMAWAKTLDGVVTHVTDGDTIRVTAGGRHSKVRLERIDAPESRQEYGRESTEYLNRRIFGKIVKVCWEEMDRYGRTLGVVFLDGVDINLEMVATGNAWHYKAFDSTQSYVEAECEAREKGLGLWSHPAPLSPETWRRRRKKNKRKGA